MEICAVVLNQQAIVHKTESRRQKAACRKQTRAFCLLLTAYCCAAAWFHGGPAAPACIATIPRDRPHVGRFERDARPTFLNSASRTTDDPSGRRHLSARSLQRRQ